MSRPATRSYIISIVCSSSSCAASVGSLNKRNLGSVLRGIAALGASEGHRGTPGPTRNRALAHQGDIDLLAGGPPIIANRRNVSSTRVGPRPVPNSHVLGHPGLSPPLFGNI